MRILQVLTTTLVMLLLLPIQALSTTALYYTSSPESWVGHGETVLVTPDQGFEFTATQNFDNGVSFAVNDFSTNPDYWATHWWYLDFAAPNMDPLTVGTYLGATRFPFQSLGEPGLNFSGNGRGNNTLTGQFSVLEANYALDGSILSFAADFKQYDEAFESWWNVGSIRYNSSIPISPVPEPSTLALLFAGVAVTFIVSRGKEKG